MNVSGLIHKAIKYTSDHSPAILTGIGAAGVLATAYLTGKATVKAVRLIDDLEQRWGNDAMLPVDKAKSVWKLYLPAASVGLCSIVCVVMANRIGDRRAAAMATMYAISERAFNEYKEKVVEKIGERKEQGYRDEIAQQRVTDNPPSNQIIIGEGSVLCMDAYTGRYFLSSMEELKSAQNAINYQVNNNFYASLSDFYQEVGLPRTSMSDDVGWNSDRLLELEFSATLSEASKPVLVMNFVVAPIRGYCRVS
jgi:hypothetical protein